MHCVFFEAELIKLRGFNFTTFRAYIRVGWHTTTAEWPPTTKQRGGVLGRRYRNVHDDLVSLKNNPVAQGPGLLV